MTDRHESEALGAARRQRHGVRAAIAALESAAASPATDPAWLPTFEHRLRLLREAFADHVAVTESDEGLFAETLDRAPRLAKRVRALAEDHRAIAVMIDALRDDAAAAAAAAPATTMEGVGPALRSAITELIGRISRHRQLGADLVFDAYNVDIEAGD